MAEERSFLYALGDNVVGFEDDYDSLGERGARALREDPVGILSTIASSLKDSAVQLGRDVKKDPLAALNTRLQDAGETYYGASKNLTKGLSGYLDQGLSVEEARDQQLVDALTVSELLGMGFGARALTKAGSAAVKKTDTGEISDSSRRNFMKGVGATGIAALAPQVVTEILEKVPAAVKRVKPISNPIDIFTENMKILRREMEEAYDAADEMDVDVTVSGSIRDAYDEAIESAEKLAYDLDATTEMDLRELISDIGPKQIAEAADESLEEISQALTDFRMVSEDEYIEQMIPLAEEIQRRGLLEVKDNGIPQYPYARTVVEDVEDYRIGENRAENNSAVIDRPRDLQMTEGDKYVTSNQLPLKQEQLRNIIIDGEADGESVEAINKKVVDTATRLKVPYPQRAFEEPKVEYVDTQTIADNVAQYNYPRYDVGTFGGDFPSGNMGNMPGVLKEFQASGKETLKENIFNEGIKEPIEIQVDLKDGGVSIGQGHHRLQAALELGMPKIPVVVKTGVNPRVDPVMHHTKIDTSGLKKFETYSFSEFGLKKRLKTPKETPEEIKARSGPVYEDYETGALSDRKFPQYITPMREGFFRVVDEKADSGLIAAEQGSNALKNILQRKADSGLIAAEQGSNALKNILQEKSDGGEMRKGVGSLSEIARRMNEGGEANIDTRSGQEVRQSIRDALKNLNDTEIQDQWGKSRKELKTALDMLILQEYHGEYEPPVTQGVGSLSETARRMNEGGPSSIDDEVNAIVPSVIMAESSNDPKAVSEDGAIGLMQVLPSTAMKPGYGLPTIFELAREQGFVVDEETPETATQLLFMPDLNVEFGSRYLKAMRNEYDTMEDALRAYNAGPGNFNDYLAKGRDLSALDDEAVQYPLRVAAAGQGINPNEPAQYEAFTDSPEAFSTFMNMASEERPPAPRPRARPSVTYDGPRPMQRPTLPQDAPQQQMIKQAVQEVVQPQSLREKYSPQGIEQMLTGTIGEPLLPRQFQQGSPYPSMQ